MKEFHRPGDAGVFENRRPFLIDGIIYEQGMMNGPHATAIIVGHDLLREVFSTGWVVRNQLPLVFALHTDPMPDFAVVRGGPRAFPTHPTTAALVLEVADTTLDTDLTEKAELSAVAGVPEYRILDLNARVLSDLRDPGPLDANGIAYRNQQHYCPDAIVSPSRTPTWS